MDTSLPAPVVLDRPAGRFFTALTLDRTSTACCLLISAALALWTVQVRGRLAAAEVLFFVALPLCAYYLGRAALAAVGFGFGQSHHAPLSLLAGALGGAVLLFGLNCASPLPMRGNVLVVVCVALAAPLVVRRRPEDGDAGRLWAVAAVAFALAAASLWTRATRPPAVEQGDVVVFKPWIDHFIHASFTARMLADGGIFGAGNWDLAGERAPFYHYGSYVFPAALCACSGQTPYDALFSIWLPFGAFLMGLAAYALAASWWGSRAGLAGLAALTLLPDPAWYGLKLPWFSYHTLLLTGAGLAYGAAVAALAFLFVVRGAACRSWSHLGLGFLVAATCLAFKAQFLVALVPLCGLWTAAFTRGLRPATRLLLGLGFAAAIAAAAVLGQVLHYGPTLVPKHFAYESTTYTTTVAGMLPDTRFKPLFAPLIAGGPVSRYPVRAVLFVAGATFGALLLAYPLLIAAAAVARRRQAVDWVPLLAGALFVSAFFLIPRNETGNADELQHRPCAWAYFLVAVWCGGKAYWLLARAWHAWPRAELLVFLAALTLLLVVPYHYAKKAISPRIDWTRAFNHVPVPVGLVRSAEFLRAHAPAGDVVEDSHYDPECVFTGLAERREYLTRPGIRESVPAEPFREVARQRRELLDRMKAAGTREALRGFLRQTGIRWYVVHPGDQFAWPADCLAHPAFVWGGFKVYDFRLLAEEADASARRY